MVNICTIIKVTLPSSMTCPNSRTSRPKLSYKSDHGEAYILIPPSSSSSVNIQCKFTQCGRNQYMNNGKCVQCPSNQISSPGSTSQSSCTPCPSGSKLPHPQSFCTITNGISIVKSAKEWRLWTLAADTENGYGWDIKKITFYSDTNCYVQIDHSLGEAFDSANVGYYDGDTWGPENAFTSGGSWGGSPSGGAFWIGQRFPNEIEVKCIKIKTPSYGNFGANKLRVQALSPSTNSSKLNRAS